MQYQLPRPTQFHQPVPVSAPRSARGFTIIEVVVSMLIVSMLVVAVLGMYTYALGQVAETRAQTDALTLAEEKIEVIRNLPYDSVGTTSGIPSGSILANETVTRNATPFTVATSIVYIDDPFDGTVGGTPNDLLGNDYKKARVDVSWTGRYGARTVLAVATVSPKGIETNVGGGTLSITVFNASGAGVPQADVTIFNPSLTPAVNVTAQTDNAGKLIFPGAPAASQSYQITATKALYSTDRTCAINAAASNCTDGNPVPTKPHATVLVGELTEISFAIDRLATLTVKTNRQATASDGTVNTDSAGANQDNPSVTVGADGKYYFAWRDDRNSARRVYGQKYTGTTPNWTPDVNFTTSNNQNNPVIAVDGSGNVYVAWQDDRNGNQDVYLNKYDSAGADAWAGGKKINTDAGSADQTTPHLTLAASSTAEYVVWQDTRTDASDVYAHKLDPSGNYLWASELKVNQNAAGSTQSNARSGLDRYERLYAVWQDNRNGNYDIYGDRFSTTGGTPAPTWGSEVKFNRNADTADQTNPALAVESPNDSTLNLYVAWQDLRTGDSDIYLTRYDADGNGVWASEVRVNSDASGTGVVQENPSLVVDASGNITVVWQDGRNGSSDIYLQQLDANGTKLIPFDVRINATSANAQERPMVTLTSSGYPLIVWHDNTAGNWDVKAAVFGADVATITPVGNVPVTISSAKRIGENPVILKYSHTHTTDGTGTTVFGDLEWDPGYSFSTTGYTLLRVEPEQPVPVAPLSNDTVYLNLQ